ncbi:hypothetical protein IFJ82_04670 [Novacetimonas hansenii]|uniref:Uncharacterized protein n=1 Tax=Novacetimonas hansenii TaxID=436 RepID=A0ABQ0SJ76_NOVHA|nr:hypothetical protein [Novacetimonas hansenii]QOF95909.1 hypothetical protein IFJ82_04670 [Novacetimonas hansenii]GAN82711.1 hypothetical protein Gaha_0035_003 [Novacetimonas hansenii JCM 7643]GBQ55946.1 hypothetical protein AA0243_1058 [Novacetimonas hansenii NRIC 0243]GEC65291.1 hypothetical protein GHA01_31400 [Novacetimonas hansenii]
MTQKYASSTFPKLSRKREHPALKIGKSLVFCAPQYAAMGCGMHIAFIFDINIQMVFSSSGGGFSRMFVLWSNNNDGFLMKMS